MADRIDLFDSTRVATATRLAAEAGEADRVRFDTADATAPLPFAAGEFDGLICIDSMNHFPDRLAVLKEWRRVLRPGARSLFTDPVVITGPVTNDELALRSSIGLFLFVPQDHNDTLIERAEGEQRFEGLQKFFQAVHDLTRERRLSRLAYVVEKPG
jgi:SAM-dependent methyltransferase